jgi:CheY-like chemotaxis protein
VILELLMPDMDGFTVVQRLRAEPLTANVPIVVLTSRGMTAADKQRLNGRINALARKSDFDQAAFADLVRRLCPVPVS